MVPNGPPSLWSAKVSCQGANKWKQTSWGIVRHWSDRGRLYSDSGRIVVGCMSGWGGQGNMKWIWREHVRRNGMLNALEMNCKAFTRKENPIRANKNKMLTKIEQNIGKQRDGGALKRAAAPLFWHGRLYLCQRLIFICGNGVLL